MDRLNMFYIAKLLIIINIIILEIISNLFCKLFLSKHKLFFKRFSKLNN